MYDCSPSIGKAYGNLIVSSKQSDLFFYLFIEYLVIKHKTHIGRLARKSGEFQLTLSVMNLPVLYGTVLRAVCNGKFLRKPSCRMAFLIASYRTSNNVSAQSPLISVRWQYFPEEKTDFFRHLCFCTKQLH